MFLYSGTSSSYTWTGNHSMQGLLVVHVSSNSSLAAGPVNTRTKYSVIMLVNPPGGAKVWQA